MDGGDLSMREGGVKHGSSGSCCSDGRVEVGTVTYAEEGTVE